jgi:hypothetical protein
MRGGGGVLDEVVCENVMNWSVKPACLYAFRPYRYLLG